MIPATPAMAMPAMAPLDMLLLGGPVEDGEDVPVAWPPLLVMMSAEFVVIVEEAAVDDVELDVEEVDGERMEERLIELIWQRTKLVVAF
jgi:hypothetical protein